MSKFRRETIDRILDVAKIEDVVGDFVDLKKKGIRYLGKCPFHEDRHLGSFVVYPKGNCYKCFSCGAKGGVVDFLMNYERLTYPDAIRWLGKKYSIETDMEEFNYTPPPPRPAPPPLELLELPKYLMAGTICNVELSELAQWIRNGIQWDDIQRKRIAQVFSDYNLGVTRQGMSVFWQIDEKGRLRTGKMMRYNADGHRAKGDGYNQDWIHAALSRHWDAERRETSYDPPYPYPHIFDPDKQEMQSCYYGMHLIDHYGPAATACIVESEKTALLMAIAYGNHQGQVWMACGGLENINRDKLQPIIDRHRRIVLYPDRDGIEKWQIKLEQLHYERATIDSRPVTKWWRPEDGPKADIADVVIRLINEHTRISTIEQAKAAMPEAKELIDKMKLETTDRSL